MAHRNTERAIAYWLSKSSRAVSLSGISGKDYTLRSDAFGGTARVLTRKVGEAQEIFVMVTLTTRRQRIARQSFYQLIQLQ
jgi:hypothetical protein